MESSMRSPRGDTLARQIRDALAERIRRGELLPGARLKDSEVAAAFGTSTTPAREALRLLMRDGLAEILPYRGCVVASVDAREIAEILDVHSAIVGFTARAAARRLTDEQWRALEAAVDDYERAVAAGERRQAAGRFHRLLIEAAGNRVLKRVHQYLANRLLLASDACLDALAEGMPYREILAALRTRDAERIDDVVAEQLARSRQMVHTALETADEQG
jgi:DNA-binding GntR family transcriptional regulator